MEKLLIFIDGGSRGNPGQGALGVVFSNKDGKVFKTYSQILGTCTNNEAEYKALIFALKKAKSLFGKAKVKKSEIEVRSDSELLIKQIKGEYKILEPKIQQLFLQAWNLKIDFSHLTFHLIPREENQQADFLVNEALNKESKIQSLF